MAYSSSSEYGVDYNTLYETMPTPRSDEDMFSLEEEQAEDGDENSSETHSDEEERKPDDEDGENKKSEQNDDPPRDMTRQRRMSMVELTAMAEADPDLLEILKNGEGIAEEDEREGHEDEDQDDDDEDEEEVGEDSDVELVDIPTSGEETDLESVSAKEEAVEQVERHTSSLEELEEDAFSFADAVSPDRMDEFIIQEDQKNEIENALQEEGSRLEDLLTGVTAEESPEVKAEESIDMEEENQEDQEAAEVTNVFQEDNCEVAMQPEREPTPDPFAWIEYEKSTTVIDEPEHRDDWYKNFMEEEGTKVEDYRTSSKESDCKSSDHESPGIHLSPRHTKRLIQNPEVIRTSQSPVGRRLYRKSAKTKPTGKESTQKSTKQTNPVIILKTVPYDLNLSSYRGLDDDFEYPSYTTSDINNVTVNEEEEKIKKIRSSSTNLKHRKSILKRKNRDALYASIHPWYSNLAQVEVTDRPDDELPSYKAKMAILNNRNMTVKMALDAMLEMTFTKIDNIERARTRKIATQISRHILIELVDFVSMDTEERIKFDAVSHSIRIVLGACEKEVTRRWLIRVDAVLDNMVDNFVFRALVRSYCDVEQEEYQAALAARDSIAVALLQLGCSQRVTIKKTSCLFTADALKPFAGETSVRAKRRVLRQKSELDKTLQNRKKLLKTAGEVKTEKQKAPVKQKNLRQMRAVVARVPTPVQERIMLAARLDEQLKTDACVVSFSRSPSRQLLVSPLPSENEQIEANPNILDRDTSQLLAQRLKTRQAVLVKWVAEDKERLLTEREEKRRFREENIQELDDEVEEDLKVKDLTAKYENEIQNELEDDEGLEELELESIQPTRCNLKEEIDKAILQLQATTELQFPGSHNSTSRPASSEVDSAVFTQTTRPDSLSYASESGALRSSDFPTMLPSDDLIMQSATANQMVTKSLQLLTPDFEKDLKEEILSLIPTVDRDQYLLHWLQYGVMHRPSPPAIPPAKRFLRKYGRSRAWSAGSSASMPEVAPISERLLHEANLKAGRLHSPASILNRPDTSTTVYTGRNSSASNVSFSEEQTLTALFSDSSSDDEDVIRTGADGRRSLQNRCEKSNEEVLAEIERQLALDLEKYKFSAGSPSEPITTKKRTVRKPNNCGTYGMRAGASSPPIELGRWEVDEIMNASKPIDLAKLNRADEASAEVLVSPKRPHKQISRDSSDASDPFPPPPTPWQPTATRPITPDSNDSEWERLMSKGMRKAPVPPPAQRMWQERMHNRNSMAKVPMPKMAWRKQPSLIGWKSVGEVIRESERKLLLESRRMQTKPTDTRSGSMKNTKRFNSDMITAENRKLFHKLQLKPKEPGIRKLLTRRKTMPQMGEVSRNGIVPDAYHRPTKAKSDIARIPRVRPTPAQKEKARVPDTDETNLPAIRSYKSGRTSTKSSSR